MRARTSDGNGFSWCIVWIAPLYAAILLVFAPTVTHAALFDDGNDRRLIKDLREKDPASLTDEEKALGTLGDGEIRLRAVHNAGDEISNLPASAKSDPMKANIATSSAAIAALMKREVSRPNFLASDIQAILSRAGCYSGKLDNQWGSGSRKALAEFATAAGVTLPSTKPSADLLATVEEAGPEGTEVCR